MSSSTVILDPTDERDPIGRQLATRSGRLRGPVGIVDISKPRGDVFCDELEILLRSRVHNLEVVRLRKPTYTKPAPPDVRDEVAKRCKAVIQALAD